jgi:CheY-like chemotaxis protein
VAQQLLKKQLEKHQLNVVTTNNGQEAIDGMLYGFYSLSPFVFTVLLEWEARGPGFFSLALFDHRMYCICLFSRMTTNLIIPRYANL